MKKLVLLFITIILIAIFGKFTPTIEAGDTWAYARKHSFCHKFQAGHEADGKPLYISMTMHGETVPSGFHGSVTFDENGHASGGAGPIFKEHQTWHLGKAGVHLSSGMSYPWGGKEYEGYEHFVFCPDNPEDYEWVADRDGHYPANAVSGWHQTENQKVCRMRWEGGVHPGKLIPGSKACYIGWGGGEKASREYEVLVRK